MSRLPGSEHHPAYRPNKVRCGAQNRYGEPCKRWAREGTDPPLCGPHLDPEKWLAMAKKGGRQTAARHRKRKRGNPLDGVDPDLPPFRILEILKDGLEATYAAVGLPRELDWSTRLLSLLVLVTIVPDAFPDVEAHPLFADVHTLARTTWDLLKRRPEIASELVTLYESQYPPAFEPAKQRAKPPA